jgi:alpha-mannosidase
VIRCKGQKITLPKTGNYNHAYILAAAETDTSGIFKSGIVKTTLHIQQWNKKIGQADLRTWDKLERLKGLEKGFIKRDEVAWFSTHLHNDTSNIPYQYGYVYLYRIDASPTSNIIELPVNESIKVFAISLAENQYDMIRPVQPLYDDFAGLPPVDLVIPKSYVKDNMVSTAEIDYHRKRKLSDLPARLTMKDFADMHQPNGVTASFYYTNADSNFRANRQSSANISDGMNIPSLTDGMFELLPSDSLLDQWSRTGEGRIVLDFQKEIEIDSLHLFAQQQLQVGSRSFSVWIAGERSNPSMKGDPGTSGWNFINYSPPEDIWGNDKALFTLRPAKGKTVKCRYLMFVSENSPFGPFYFREADVFEKQQ